MWVALIALAACSVPDPLLALRDRGDVAAIRAHGWQTWAALPSAWDAWTPTERLFGGAAATAHPRFRAPRPFRIGDRIEAETASAMFDVRFNASAAAHIRTHHLDRHDSLVQLAAFPAFPTDAIAVKLVWFPIHARGLTAMPIWDGDPANADGDGNPDRSWHRAIAVDPSRDAIPDGETADGAHVVPLAAFLHRTLDADDLATARQASGDATLEVGDFVALVAAHVTTKEIPDWTWETFWWHDHPDEGAFAAGRPDAIRGAARHYLMDVVFSTEPASFNPWLEARFPNGMHSNCVTCHQRAVVGAADYLPVTRGRLRGDDPYFIGHVPTDFMWSIALEAR